MNNYITIKDIKEALRDSRFRNSLPKEMGTDVSKFLDNPGCACNIPFYKKIFYNCKEQLIKYFPNKKVTNELEEIKNLAENNWTVINCNIDELEAKLAKLGPGRKQLDVARFNDQVTVVINDLDLIF